MATTELEARPSEPELGKRPKDRRGGQKDAWPLLMPALIPVAVFSVLPLLQGIYLGFTDARAGLNQVTHFTGLQNYRDLLSYDLFWQSFRIGLVWAVSVTFLQFASAMGLAQVSPKIFTVVSILRTSIRRRARIVILSKSSRFALRVLSASTPLAR